MPQDAFTLRLVAKELDETLSGGRINRINQPSRDEVSLLIYTGKRTLKLSLNANASDCGAYFDGTETENPAVAPNFCMLLRKHIQGALVSSVGLVGFERILRFRLLCGSDFSTAERELYLEVMGKYSNLILTENGVILGALKTTSLDDAVRRMIFPGVKYVLPAPQDKADPSDEGALRAVLQSPMEDLGRFLFTRVAGLAPSTAEQIAASYKGGDLCDHVRTFLFSDDISPCVLERNGAPVDFYARAVAGATRYPTLSAAQSAFYDKKRTVRRFEGAQRKLSSAASAAIKKQEKRLALLLEKREAVSDAESLRIKGEVLTANLFAVKRGETGVKLPNFYEDGALLSIRLDPSLSPAQNAQSYFKRYRKAKRTLEMLVPQEAETRAELDYLRSLLAAVASAESREDLVSVEEEMTEAGLLRAEQHPKKHTQAIPYRTYEREGFRIFAGRNNLQNDRLVRQSSESDLWLHARGLHSCHAVIKTEGRRVPESVKRFAAAVCAKFSDGHGERIPVDCCEVKYVKKPPKSKAGFVLYSKFETLAGDPTLLSE